MAHSYFARPSVALPKLERSQINTGILKLIRSGQTPEPPRVFTAYTGQGGLHELDYSNFSNRSEFTQAKQAIEQGQFFTPDSVVELTAKILDAPSGSVICDPTCGHGAFFNWFPDCRLLGNDSDTDATTVAKYLFTQAEIETTDLRVYNPPVPPNYIVGNPPFGLRWTTLKEWGNQTKDAQRSEDLFLEFIARNLCLGGSALFVVPISWPNDEMLYAHTQKLLKDHLIVEAEFHLSPTLFQPYGCNFIQTKLLLLRTKLDKEEEQHRFPTIDAKEKAIEQVIQEWKTAGTKYFEFRQKAQSQRARLTLKQSQLLNNNADKVSLYLFRKYAYHLARSNPALADRAWQRWAEAHEPKPADMQWEEWETMRLKPATVLKETRTALKRQHLKPKPIVRPTLTKSGLRLKAYSPSASAALAHQSEFWSWLELENTDPEFTRLSDNLNRLNSRKDKQPIQFAPFNWAKALKRRRKTMAAWRSSLEAPASEADLAITEAGYLHLKTGYGFDIRKEPLQEQKLAQIINKPGALLAWQQGTGKTYAALVYQWVKSQKDQAAGRRSGATLLITSRLAIDMHWLGVLKKAKRHIVSHKESFPSLTPDSWLVLTHSQAHKWRDQLRHLAKQKLITCLILDESDEFANHTSQRYRAIRAFSSKIRYRLLTTGTPARNTASELFTQLDIIFGGSPLFQCIAPTFSVEEKDGELAEVDNPDYLEPYRPVRGYNLFRRCHAPTKTTVLGRQRALPALANRQGLVAFLKTIRSRLTIEELLGYDPVYTQIINVAPTTDEDALYQNILKNTAVFIRREIKESALQNRKLNQLAIAQSIRILQQACSIPRHYPEFTGRTQAKQEYILKECQTNAHTHIAIGTLWKNAATQLAAFLQNQLDFFGYPVICYTGDQSTKERTVLLKQFTSSPKSVLITTQQALRSSLNIRCVSKVIVESLPWNFSALGQYTRRFARYDSQFDRIEVDLLVTEGTIEERILGLNLRKEGVAAMAAGDLVEDDLDPLLEEYGVDPSSLLLLAQYLAGEQDESMDIKNLKTELRQTDYKVAA